MTRFTRWIQIIALLPATILLGPALAAASVAALGVAVLSLIPAPGAHVDLGSASAALKLMALGGAVCLGLIASWIALLSGANGRIPKRWLFIVRFAIALGLLAATYWLAWFWDPGRSSGLVVKVIWTLVMAPAFVVGLRQIVALFRLPPTLN